MCLHLLGGSQRTDSGIRGTFLALDSEPNMEESAKADHETAFFLHESPAVSRLT